jgi:acyl-CoA synthetase (AMP-forming)/AMP-acid ligase II
MKTLADMITRGVRLYGAQTAVIFDGRSYTFAEQASRMYRLANALFARGVRQQERVAILARNCSEYIEVFGAGEVAGFTIVNLNIRLAEPELVTICADCRPAVLLFTEEFATLAARLVETTPSIRRTFCIGGEAAGAERYEDVLRGASAEPPALRPRADHTAYLMYTSGTTGGPKGVMIGHAAALEAARTLSHEAGPPPGKSLIVMPLFHLGGKIEHMAFSLLGNTIVLKSAFDAIDILRTIERERIVAAHFAPVMVQRLLDELEVSSFDVTSLRCVHYASAPMPVPVLRRAIARLGPIFIQVYGMTECIVGSILLPQHHRPDGDETDIRRLASAGQPTWGNDVKVVRPDGSDCAVGEIGEILFHSPTVTQGYWNNHTATVEALRDGWYHTQDLGEIDADGFLYVLDRKKDMIISGGENIYSWEVEEALRTHPAVAEVAVIAVPDTSWGEAVKACVVLRSGHAASDGEIIDHCRSRIASYKKPRSVDFLEALPRVFNGKVDKKALRAKYWQSQDRQVS